MYDLRRSTQEPIIIGGQELVSLNPKKRKGSFEYAIFKEKISHLQNAEFLQRPGC